MLMNRPGLEKLPWLDAEACRSRPAVVERYPGFRLWRARIQARDRIRRHLQISPPKDERVEARSVTRRETRTMSEETLLHARLLVWRPAVREETG